MFKRSRNLAAAIAAGLLLGACAGGTSVGSGLGYNAYRLVEPDQRRVARDSMIVQPTRAWNRAPRARTDISREENWTLNGPYLDNLTFIGGVLSGEPLVRFQRRKEWRQVPDFRADMSPNEIADLIETFFRVRGGSVRYETTALRPRTFLGHPGFEFDYERLGGDEVERRGRAAAAVINNRLYMILFDAAEMHYFPAAIGEVERIIDTARLPSSR
jgi:hypothetical protein